MTRSADKIMATVFWDWKDPAGVTTTQDTYEQTLKALQTAIRCKHEDIVLLHDNARPHTVQSRTNLRILYGKFLDGPLILQIWHRAISFSILNWRNHLMDASSLGRSKTLSVCSSIGCSKSHNKMNNCICITVCIHSRYHLFSQFSYHMWLTTPKCCWHGQCSVYIVYGAKPTIRIVGRFAALKEHVWMKTWSVYIQRTIKKNSKKKSKNVSHY